MGSGTKKGITQSTGEEADDTEYFYSPSEDFDALLDEVIELVFRSKETFKV